MKVLHAVSMTSWYNSVVRRRTVVSVEDPLKRSQSIKTPTDTKNPLLNYGVVIDCGSSGSRIYVYFWPPHDGTEDELLNIQEMIDKDLKPVAKKVSPGKYDAKKLITWCFRMKDNMFEKSKVQAMFINNISYLGKLRFESEENVLL